MLRLDSRFLFLLAAVLIPAAGAVTVSVTSSANPAVYAAPLTFTIAVLPPTAGDPMPTGTVSATFAGAAQVASASLDATGHAVIAVPQMLGVGSNTITFSYTGDATYAPSQSVFTQFLRKANTHTAATLSRNHLTATVRIDEPSASAGAAPSGTVQFFDGPNLLGTATLAPSSLLTSVATIAASTIPANLRTAYSGDNNFNVSTSTSAVQTGTGTVTLSVTSSANPSIFAEPVTMKIVVAPEPRLRIPTGSVDVSLLGLFSLGSVTLDAAGQGSLTVPLNSAQATSIPWGFAAGSNSVTLTYSGDANYATAQATFTQAVNKAGTAIGAIATGHGVSATVSASNPAIAPIGFALPGGNAGSANPTGNVQFLQDGVAIGTARLSPTGHMQSTALLSTASASPIVAVYSGDANYNGSTSSSATQPSQAATTITVTSSANPTSFAQPVTFSVTVAPAVAGGAIPTGKVQATVLGSETLATATLDSGLAQFAVPQYPGPSLPLPWGLATGSNVITVTYSGDSNYAQGQTTFNEMVNKQDTLTTVLMAPAVAAKSFTIVATVAFHALQILTTPFAIPSTGSMSPSATGNVAFFDGTTLIGTVALTQEINFTSTATLTTASAPTSVSAVYYGDTNFNGSSSASTNVSAGAPVTVSAGAGGASLVYGEAFPLVAWVTPAILGSPSPTGTLTFFDGSQDLGWTATLDAAGSGTLPMPEPLPAVCAPTCPAAAPVLVLSPGTHSITVMYSGDANYAGMSSPPVTLQIAKAPSVTSLAGVCAGLLPGQCNVLANVADAQPPAGGPVHFMTMGPSGLVDGDPSGAVQFFNGTTSAGTAPLTSSTSLDADSTASLSTTVGASSAVYPGDANFLGSSSTVTPKIATMVDLTASPNPSTVGQTVTLTANVLPISGLNPAIVAPTGTVTFLDSGTQLGQVALITGMATFSTAFTSAGPHILSATYSGDGVYLPSTSVGYGQMVTPQSGTLGMLTLTASTPSASFGQQMTFFVTSAPLGNAPPGGGVTLLDGASVVGGGNWDSGSAPVVVTLPVGTHQLSAVWPGGAGYPPAVSPVLTYIVTRASTTVTLGTPSTNTTSGQVGLVATVTAYPPGAGTPSGTVQFIDTATQAVLATSTLIGGSATATLPASSASGSITATYPGDPNFAPSTTSPPSLAMVTMSGVIASVASPDEIVTIYGANLASSPVTVTDITGATRPAYLYYFSPGQINLVIPTGSASGPATLSVGSQNIAISLTPVSPNLFPVGQIVAVHPDGTQSVYDTNAPISFGSDTLYLVLYATGIRSRSSLAAVTCTIGNNLALPVTYAGAQSQYPGLDQVVVPLPAGLQGVGMVRVVVSADGYGSNALSLTFQ